MGRVARVLLLAFAVAVLSAAPAAGAGGQGDTVSSGATVSDPSQQLSSGAPAARRNHVRTTVIDVTGRFDRIDSHSRQLTATMAAVVEVAGLSALVERLDEVDPLRVGTVSTRASGRGPPADSAHTSI